MSSFIVDSKLEFRSDKIKTLMKNIVRVEMLWHIAANLDCLAASVRIVLSLEYAEVITHRDHCCTMVEFHVGLNVLYTLHIICGTKIENT